jgi:hypothetical protein
MGNYRLCELVDAEGQPRYVYATNGLRPWGPLSKVVRWCREHQFAERTILSRIEGRMAAALVRLRIAEIHRMCGGHSDFLLHEKCVNGVGPLHQIGARVRVTDESGTTIYPSIAAYARVRGTARQTESRRLHFGPPEPGRLVELEKANDS